MVHLGVSCATGVFSDEMEMIHVLPLLKKLGLDPEQLNSFRLISLLSFITKFLEQVVVRQLNIPLLSQTSSLALPSNSCLYESAYRRFNSTETA